MRLDQLAGDGARIVGDGGVDVTGLAVDSRAVRPGDLFAALAGETVDGRAFAASALDQGAAAILSDPSIEGLGLDAPLLLDPEPRRRLALAASTFFARQPERIVAVTGTNGKTSVAWFARLLWRALGHDHAAALGTLGAIGPIANEGGLTTPDPIALHRTLARLADASCDRLALEASSHGLAQHRLDGIAPRAAAFTNLSRDHLDYHPTFEAYFAAKARLFDDLLPEGACAVLNAGAEQFGALREIAARRALRVVAYGRGAAPFGFDQSAPDGAGQRIALRVPGVVREMRVPLIGAFQAENLLAAMALVWAAEGCDDALLAPMADALATIEAPPGRMQRAAIGPAGQAIYVDYSHTPDSLRAALSALRPHVRGKIVAIFGCGGDRDPGKRALMGEAAAKGADRVVVTDDNPRSEDPAAIRRAALVGAPDAREIGDRGEAIRYGSAALEPGDALLIAGKGHERGQIVKDRVLPFDDVTAALDAARDLGWRL